MSPRPDVSEERRRQILDAALKVFARLGLDRARMDDIVAEAGLSKGALYWYFQGKDDIIIALLEAVFAREASALQALLEADGPVYDRLLALVAHTAAELSAMTHLAPLVYEFYALAFRHPRVRQALQADLRRYVTYAVPLIEAGVERREFRPTDARQAANGLAAIVEGTLLLWVIDPDGVDLEAQIQAAGRTYLDGLK